MRENRENSQNDQYFIDESFDDKEKCCVHVPVLMPKIKDIPDINIEIVGDIFKKITSKFSSQNIDFTGKWDISTGDNEIKEYLFFYENKVQK